MSQFRDTLTCVNEATPTHSPPRAVLGPEHPHRQYALEVRDLWAGYPGQPPALEGVTLSVAEGELVGLIGPAAGIAIVALLFKQQPKPDFSRVDPATK